MLFRSNNCFPVTIEYGGGRCSNCGNNDSDVLTFHHTNPRTKKFTLCSNWQKKWDTIVEEHDRKDNADS